jgi:hypothetical protein
MFRTPGDVTRTSVRIPTPAVSARPETSQMPNDPHILGVVIMTTGVGLAMTWLAARLNLIELRRPETCPACGRRRNLRGTCGCR